MNSREMQKTNRLLVLRTLLEDGGMMRTELADKSGLQKATITNIINEFLENGVVEIDGQPASGRRGERVGLRLDDCYILSVLLNRKLFQAAIYTLDGEQIDRSGGSLQPDTDEQEILSGILGAVRDLLGRYGEEKVLGICLGLPGPYVVDPENGNEIALVTHFEQLGRMNLRAEMEKALGMKVFSMHDAKLSALAEWKTSEAARENPRVSLAAVSSVGYGIGSGYVINGQVVRGHFGIAGEIGRTGINYNARRTPNGFEGTYEFCAGAESATRYVQERLFEFPDSMLTENSTYDEIVRAYKQNDPLAVYAMEKIAWMLGYGLANLIYAIDPDYIILEEKYPDYPPFLEKVRQSVRQFVDPYIFERVSITHSKLKYDSVLLGGYYYILEKLLKEGDLLEKIQRIKQM